MRHTLAIVLLFVLWTADSSNAQTFSSGSTGADGALDLATMNCTGPGGICEVQLPPSGVLNYTTVNVSVGKQLVFKKNINNTPVVMLAQGDINIAGEIWVAPPMSMAGSPYNVSYREPGPGGFHGGAAGQPGFGPGGATSVSAARWVGPLDLVPIIGGSGGYSDVGGGGGGGAIVIASSAAINISGSISAIGQNQPSYYQYAAGSGGAIRLVANSVSVTGGLNAQGSLPGVIRIEAPTGALSFTGTSYPAAVLSTINPAIFSATPSSLSIVSVGGFSVPVYAGQRFDTVDVLLPMQLTDPIDVVVNATNIPVGTPVTITFGTTNAGTVVPGTLTGSLLSSSATVQISGLNRSALAFLFVSSTFPVQSASNLQGVDRVAQVRVSAPPGGPTQVAYLRADGSEVDPGRLPAEFLRQFQR